VETRICRIEKGEKTEGRKRPGQIAIKGNEKEERGGTKRVSVVARPLSMRKRASHGFREKCGMYCEELRALTSTGGTAVAKSGVLSARNAEFDRRRGKELEEEDRSDGPS